MALHGKTALVTGGAARIGRALCEGLAAAGCTVVVHAHRSTKEARALAQTLDGHAVGGDLADPAVVEGLVDAARDAAGGLDFVVNNASAFPETTLAAATYDDLDAMMRLHAWAPLALARALARAPGEPAGKAVVNLLDARIVSRDAQHFPYLLSKQALWHLTASLARELAPLRVNAVAPGPILPPPGGDAAGMEGAVRATLLGRAGTPKEVAHAVLFLLQAEYVTGQTVFVDGGRHLRG